MPSPKKSFSEKLADGKDFPRVQPIPKGMERTLGPGTILLPAVSEVAALMRSVPKGKVTTINHLRAVLAERHGATTACPIVTGIEARIVAGAAGEDEDEGKKRVAPYWRTLKANGILNAKYPGGVERQKERLEREGLRVLAKGKQHAVADFEDYLATLRVDP